MNWTGLRVRGCAREEGVYEIDQEMDTRRRREIHRERMRDKRKNA